MNDNELTGEELDEQLAKAGLATKEDFEALLQMLRRGDDLTISQRMARHETMLRVINSLGEELAK